MGWGGRNRLRAPLYEKEIPFKRSATGRIGGRRLHAHTLWGCCAVPGTRIVLADTLGKGAQYKAVGVQGGGGHIISPLDVEYHHYTACFLERKTLFAPGG